MALGVLVGTMMGQLGFGFAVREFALMFPCFSLGLIALVQADWLGRKLMFIATLVMIILFATLSAFSFPIDGKVRPSAFDLVRTPTRLRGVGVDQLGHI